MLVVFKCPSRLVLLVNARSEIPARNIRKCHLKQKWQRSKKHDGTAIQSKLNYHYLKFPMAKENNTPIDRVLAALSNPKQEGDCWRASCPGPKHNNGNGRNPALSITESDDGKVLLKCHAGCGVSDIVGAIGLDLKDLFPPKNSRPARKPEKPMSVRTSPPDSKDDESRFTYVAKDKHPVIYVIREDRPDGKRIRQWGPGPSGKGWIPSLKHAPKPRPLYHLPEILKTDDVVCIHEGEKCAIAACKASLYGVHTTTLGGAGNAHHTDLRPLKGRDIVLVPDNDEPGRKHVEQLVKLASAAGVKSVRTVHLPDLPAKGDVIEWLQAGGTNEQWRRLLDDAKPSDTQQGESMSDAVRRLAKLPPLDFSKARSAEAKALGVQVSVLDAEVKNARKTANNGGTLFPDIEPCAEPVDGSALLDEIATIFQRYVVLPKHADTVAALWVLNTYVHDASYYSPMIVLTSPEKRCGKTTALNVFNALCNRALSASNVSGAVVFRAIEKWNPTLLIDEADTFMRDNDDLRGVINSGHSKDGAFVLRCDGDANEPRRFSTWCPKVLSGIGKMRDTLEDRSIIFPLRRKLPTDKVAKLRIDRGGFDKVKKKCQRWADDNFSTLADSDPDTPQGLDDRASDNWAPLFAIADLCGWRENAEAAALELSADADTAESVNAMLLGDVQKVFQEQRTDKMPSQKLCDALAEMEEKPWPEWCKGKPITPRQLAKRLGAFGIHPDTIRAPEPIKGYELSKFKDAFTRYCDSKRYTVTTQGAQQEMDTSKRYSVDDVTDENCQKMKQGKGCNVVTDKKPHSTDKRVQVSI